MRWCRYSFKPSHTIDVHPFCMAGVWLVNSVAWRQEDSLWCRTAIRFRSASWPVCRTMECQDLFEWECGCAVDEASKIWLTQIWYWEYHRNVWVSYHKVVYFSSAFLFEATLSINGRNQVWFSSMNFTTLRKSFQRFNNSIPAGAKKALKKFGAFFVIYYLPEF